MLATGLIGVIIGTVGSLLPVQTARAVTQTIPYKINFQGRLTDNNGNVLSDGSYNIKFRIWKLASGGTNDCITTQVNCSWETDRVYGASDHRITVTNGLFNIQFGDTSQGDPALSPSLFSGTYPLYLEVELPTPATATCASNGCASFTEGAMTPRQALAASPYAFNSDTLDGLDSSAFGQIAATNTYTAANLFAPTASSTVALTVKATTAGSTNSLEVFDSGGTRQAYFDANGNFNVARTIQATSNNAIDLGSSGTAFRSGYFGTSVQSPSFTGSGAVSLASGASASLTLDAAGGTVILGSNTTTIQKSGTAFTIDLNSASASTSTLTITNSATGTAALSVEGSISAGGTVTGTTLNATTGLNTGAGAGTQRIDASGNITTGSGTITSTGAITGGSFKVGANDINTGGTLNNVDYLDTAQNISATKTFNKSSGQGAIFSGTAASGGAQLQFGSAALTSGSANGTYIGANPASYTGDFVNFQIGGAVKLKVDNSGNTTIAGSLNVGGVAAFSASGLLQNVALDSTVPYSNITKVGTLTVGALGSGFTAVNVAQGGTGANTLAANGILQGNGTGAVTAIAPGGTGTVLLSNGTTASFTTITNASLTAGTYSNITGTGALAAGSIASGFGTIATANTISTSSNISTTGSGTITSAGGFIGPSLDAASGTLTLGSANASAVNVGNATAATTVAIQGGTNATNAIGLTAAANGTILGTTTGTGNIKFNTASSIIAQSTANSATAFQIQNAANTPVLNVDTTGTNASNLITTITASGTASFEGNSTTGWTGDGASPCTPAAVTAATTPPFSGIYSGQCAATAAGHGFKYATGLTGVPVSGTYTLSFYAKVSATTGNFLSFGYVQNGGGEDAAGLSMTTQSIGTSGWTRYSLTFKTGATNGAGDYIYIKQTDATTRSIWLDGVTLQTDANADTNFREAKLQVSGIITSALVLQNASNSTNALVIQNSAGTNVLNVDTTDTNLVSNPGLEVNMTGWALKGSAGIVISRDLTTSYTGQASLKVVTTAVAQDGAKFTYANTLLTSGATYTLSFFAKISGSSIATLTFGRADNGVAETNCVTTGTLTTAWTRFSCSFVAGAQSSTPYIFISQGTTATTQTFWIDSVQLETGSTATAYGAGAVSLNGVINSATSFQNKTDSTAAFQIQNAAATSTYFQVDTANSKVSIGAGAITVTNNQTGVIIGSGYSSTDTTLTPLTLDSTSTFAETANTCTATANGGALYYNSNTNAIRSCINGGWEDVVTTAGLGIMLFGVVPDSGTNNAGDLPSLVTAGTSGPCKVSWSGVFTVSVAPCTAYSGGRKVVVANPTTVTLDHLVSGEWEHLCFNASGALPTTLVAGTSTEANTANLPNFSPSAPGLCLADILMTGTTAVAQIHDVRTFTTSIKEFATASTILGLGWIACPTGKNVTPCGTSVGADMISGVVVATNGATSTTQPNVILAVEGPTMVKALTTANAAGDLIYNSTTANRVQATQTTNPSAIYTTLNYNILGISRSASPAIACTTTQNAANCDYQMYFFQSRR